MDTHSLGLGFIISLTLKEWAEYGQIASGIGALIAAFGIILVMIQVRFQAMESAIMAQDSRAELVTTLTSLMVSISQVFIEHPKMRAYFHENKTPPEGDDYERAKAVAVGIANAMDHISANLHRMEPATRTAWINYMRDMYNCSVVLRTYLEGHWEWYGPWLRESLGLVSHESCCPA